MLRLQERLQADVRRIEKGRILLRYSRLRALHGWIRRPGAPDSNNYDCDGRNHDQQAQQGEEELPQIHKSGHKRLKKTGTI